MVVDYINARIRPISSPFFMPLVQRSIAVSKTADVGSNPSGHVSINLLKKRRTRNEDNSRNNT